MTDKPYKISGIVDNDEVPDWERRPAKWDDLVEAVLSLEPGKSLEIEFDDAGDAENARNAVRDRANLEARTIVCRTRLVSHDDGSGTLYLIRLEGQKVEEET